MSLQLNCKQTETCSGEDTGMYFYLKTMNLAVDAFNKIVEKLKLIEGLLHLLEDNSVA